MATNPFPMYAGGFDPGFANQYETAYQNLVDQLVALSNLENLTNQTYERQYGSQVAQNALNERALKGALANRGTIRSGIGVGALANQSARQSESLSDLLGTKQLSLSDIASKRLQAQSGYNQSVTNLESEAASLASENYVKQLAAEAQRRQNEAQTNWQNQMSAQQNAYQQQMLGMYQNQPMFPGFATTAPSPSSTSTAPYKPTYAPSVKQPLQPYKPGSKY